MNNPFEQLSNLYNKPQMLPGEVTQVSHLSQDDKTLLRRIGLTTTQVQRDLLADAQIFYDRYNIYHQVEKALEHPIVGAATELYANYCCLTGDTKIPLLDGRTLTIREILEEHKEGKENWVYSCDYNGKSQPAKIINAIKQKHTPKTFRVWLDNGKYVDVSDNHKFIKRDGSLCRTDELVVGDSLMPLHRSVTKNGYELVWDVAKGSWESTHKMVAQHFCGVNLKEANKGKSVADDSCLIVHHKQNEDGGFNKRNNNPLMLEVIISKEHRAIHNKVLVERWNDPEARRIQGDKLRILNQDPEFRRKSKEGHGTPEYLKKMRKHWDGQIGDKVRGAKISKGRKAYVNSTTFEERYRIPRETRICAAPGCDTIFDCIITSGRRYCCSGHGRRGRTYISPKRGRVIVPREIRVCALDGCDISFEVKLSDNKRFCSTTCANKDVETNKRRGEAISKTKTLVPSYNHKITKIEYIGEKEVYDIEVDGSNLFGLDIGIYIHNSVFSPLHNATIWITSESPTYQKELTKLLDRIGIEEKIFDWAFTTGSYGDMFVKINGIPGQGIISIDDSDHPINISRVDHEGVLIGYYKTPVGQAGDQQRLMAPWEYVHFRLLGGKKQRPQFGDQSYAEYRTVHLLTGLRSKQVTTRYGTSVIMNALAIYRRLRLAEDSLLIARLSRGLVRYVWKLKVDSSNMEAVGELIDQYSRVLREARSMDTREGSPNFDSKENPMASIEDIFIPVWDNVGDLTFDKIGGEADIRWIKDIEDLRQQLSSALRVPLPLLGAWLKEATGALGSQAIEKVDINFARMARKLQRTIRTGIKRICQIHLAYMNMDPDPNLFDVQMPEMSTAEEESLKESLKDGMEVVSSMMEVIEGIVENTNKELDKIEIFNYLNEKFLKLEDFDLKEYLVAAEEPVIEESPIEEFPEEEQPLERKKRADRDRLLKGLRENCRVCNKRKERMVHELKVKTLLEKAMSKTEEDRVFQKPCLFDTDLHSYVPTRTTVNGEINEKAVIKLGRTGGWLGIERCMEVWQKTYGNALVEEKDPDDMVDGEVDGQQMLLFKE